MPIFHLNAPALLLIPALAGLLLFPMPQKSIQSAGGATPLKVVVTNTLDAADGDVSSISALQAAPGADGGISLREAMLAANHTPGPKIIAFSPAISGGTIHVGATTGDILPIMTGGDLTIDGDSDGDGAPDITIDGSKRGGSLGNGLSIWSNNVTLQHLHLSGFSEAILWGVPGDDVPEQMTVRTVSNSQILNNVIDGALPGESQATGVMVGALGWLNVKRTAQLSNITYQNFVISGNAIDLPVGIFMYASGGSGGHNLISHVTIADNSLTGGGIGMTAGDANTVDAGAAPPPDYSDDNTIEDVQVIDNSLVDFRYVGITLAAANEGNRGNTLQRISVSGNSLRGSPSGSFAAGPGILLISGGGSTWADRFTTDNLVSDVEIHDNTLQDLFQGILICAGQAWGGPGVSGNSIVRVKVVDNQLTNVGPVGIAASGGFYNNIGGTIAGNTIDTLTISGNVISGLRGGPPGEAIHVSGGWNAPYYNSSGPTTGNAVTHLLVSGNRVSGFDTGLSVSGGDGPGVSGNSVSGYWDDNQGAQLSADDLNGATDNHLTRQAPYQVYIPLVTH
jgi:hypothetical protein